MTYNQKPYYLSPTTPGVPVTPGVKGIGDVFLGIAPFPDPTSYTGDLPGFLAEWRFEEKTGQTITNSHIKGRRKYFQTITGIPTRSATGISYNTNVYSTAQFNGKPLQTFTIHVAALIPVTIPSFVSFFCNVPSLTTTLWCGSNGTAPQLTIQAKAILADVQTTINDGRYHVWTFHYDGFVATIFVDGYPIFNSNVLVGNTLDPTWANLQIADLATMFVGKLNSVYLPSNAEIGFIAFYEQAHTFTQVKSYSNWIRARMISRGAVMAAQNLICNCGDSITIGDLGTFPHYWRERALNTLGANGILRPTVAMEAVFGTKTNEHFSTPNTPTASQPNATRYTQKRLNMLQKGVGRNVLTLGFAANDLSVYTPAQVLADQAAMIAQARIDGWDKIIVLTPTSNSNNSPTNATTFTNGILAGIGQDYTVDIWNDPTMGGVGPSTNTALYADGIHPTSLGQDNIGDLVAPYYVLALS